VRRAEMPCAGARDAEVDADGRRTIGIGKIASNFNCV
jgi:hypothetical protein